MTCTNQVFTHQSIRRAPLFSYTYLATVDSEHANGNSHPTAIVEPRELGTVLRCQRAQSEEQGSRAHQERHSVRGIGRTAPLLTRNVDTDFLAPFSHSGLFVGCLTSQQHASISQGRICSDNFMCCHTEIQVADPTFYLTQSQYTDTVPTSPSAEPKMPDA